MQTNRKRIWTGLGAITVILVGVTAASSAKTECQLAKEWVVAHSDALPRTLADLSLHSIAIRRQVVAALPLEDRASLWREHFSAILNGPDALNESQRAFVREVSARTPEFLAEPALAADAKKRMVALFSIQQSARYFATLGPTNDPALLGNTAFAADGAACTCSAGGTNFCSLFTCRNLGNCETSQSGCGWLWSEPCDGFCGNIEESEDTEGTKE